MDGDKKGADQAPSVESKPFRDRLIFSGIFACFTLLYLVAFWDQTALYRQHRTIGKWPTVACEIQDARVRLGGKKGSPSFEVTTQYYYSISGSQRIAKNLWFGYDGHEDLADALAFAKELQTSPKRRCLVDPHHPEEAFLMQSPVPNSAAALFWFGTCVLGILLQAMVWLWPISKAPPKALPVPETEPEPIPNNQPRTPTWAKLLLSLFFTGTIVASGYVLYLGVASLSFGIVWQGNYQKVDCTITSVRRVELSQVPDNSVIGFAYHLSATEHYQGSAIGLSRLANAPVYSLSKGDHATCYYHPGHPDRAFLFTGTHSWNWIQSIGSLLFLSALLWASVFTYRLVNKPPLG
jgi:hypothetical protein